MSTNAPKTSRKWLAAISLAGLLLAAQPVWAANKSSKRPAKSEASTATCTSGGSTSLSPDVDRKLGTAITWIQSPDEASKVAADQDKLVFMIQVSGNFARQEFT